MSVMRAPVDFRYAGGVIGEATALRDVGAGGLVAVMADPMPVGTALDLVGQDNEVSLPARVERVVESVVPEECGMRLRLVGELGHKVEIEGTTVAMSA